MKKEEKESNEEEEEMYWTHEVYDNHNKQLILMDNYTPICVLEVENLIKRALKKHKDSGNILVIL